MAVVDGILFYSVYVRLSKCKPNKKPRSIIVIYQDNFKRSLTAHDINDVNKRLITNWEQRNIKAIVYRNVIIYIVLVVI